MINHKIFNLDLDLEWFRANISLGLIALALIGAYLPGRASSFFIVPALIVLWTERSHIRFDSDIKRIFFFYLAYLIIFTVTSQNIFRSLDGVYHVIRGLLFFPLALVFAKFASQRGLLIVNTLAAVCIAGNLGFERYFFASDVLKFSFFSYYVNPNNAAVHLVGLLVFTAPYHSSRKWRLSNWFLSGIGMVVGLYLLALTNARGAWLGLVGSIIALLGIKRGLPLWTKVLLGALSLACLVTSVVFLNAKGFQFSSRAGLWEGLFHATIQNHLLLGYGIELVKQVIIQQELITVTAHNIFLEIFVCSGLIGILWISTIMILLLRHLLRFSYRQNSLWCMGVIGLLAFLIMAQFDLKFYAFRFNASMSFSLGLIYSQRIYETSDMKPVLANNSSKVY